jgi:hypothetical protein
MSGEVSLSTSHMVPQVVERQKGSLALFNPFAKDINILCEGKSS